MAVKTAIRFLFCSLARAIYDSDGCSPSWIVPGFKKVLKARNKYVTGISPLQGFWTVRLLFSQGFTQCWYISALQALKDSYLKLSA